MIKSPWRSVERRVSETTSRELVLFEEVRRYKNVYVIQRWIFQEGQVSLRWLLRGRRIFRDSGWGFVNIRNQKSPQYCFMVSDPRNLLGLNKRVRSSGSSFTVVLVKDHSGDPERRTERLPVVERHKSVLEKKHVCFFVLPRETTVKNFTAIT